MLVRDRQWLSVVSGTLKSAKMLYKHPQLRRDLCVALTFIQKFAFAHVPLWLKGKPQGSGFNFSPAGRPL